MKLTEDQILRNKHVSTHIVEMDIEDTQREINNYNEELKTLEKNPLENKVAIYMRKGRIFARQDFIESMNSILKYRKANKQT